MKCYGDTDDSEMCLQDIIPSGENIEEDCIDNISKKQAALELWNEVEQLDGQQAQIIKARYKYRNTRSAAACKYRCELQRGASTREKSYCSTAHAEKTS